MSKTHVFYPFAVETAGVWHELAIELTQEIGRHITSHRRHQGNHLPVPTPFHGSSERECGCLPEHRDHQVKRRFIHYTFLLGLLQYYHACGFVLVG